MLLVLDHEERWDSLPCFAHGIGYIPSFAESDGIDGSMCTAIFGQLLVILTVYTTAFAPAAHRKTSTPRSNVFLISALTILQSGHDTKVKL